jgi:hypothetical protein
MKYLILSAKVTTDSFSAMDCAVGASAGTRRLYP